MPKENFSYDKIYKIIFDREMPEKKKLELIFVEFQANFESFVNIFIDYSYPEFSPKRYNNIQSVLNLAVKQNLFFVTKFFLNFCDLLVEKPQLVFLDLRSINHSLRDRELGKKKSKIRFNSQIKLDIINSSFNKQPSLLLLAAKYDFEGRMIKLLLDQGANPNLISFKRSVVSHTQLGSVLPYYTEEGNYSTALSEVINFENEAGFSILTSHSDLNLGNSLKYLNDNNLGCRNKLIKLLLDQIDDIKIFDKDEVSFLHEVFLIQGYSGLFIDLLNKNKENINILTKGRNTLLHSALLYFNPTHYKDIMSDDYLHVEFLLKSGVNINAQNDDGNTALHLVAIMTFLDENGVIDPARKRKIGRLIECLLEYNADREIKNNLGQTALDIGSTEYKTIISSIDFSQRIDEIILDQYTDEKEKIESILMEHEINPLISQKIFLPKESDGHFFSFSDDTKNSYLLKIFILAVSRNFFNLTEFLLLMPTTLFKEKELDDGQLIFRKKILSENDQKDFSLLHISALNDDTGRMFRLLMDHECYSRWWINPHQDLWFTYQETALEFAIANKNNAIISIIIDHEFFDPKADLIRLFSKDSLSNLELNLFAKLLEKLDLQKTNKFGENFLHQIVKLSRNNSLLEMLLEGKKPDLEAKTSEGLTPLHIALSESTTEAARILLKFGASPKSLNSLNATPFDYMLRCKIIDFHSFHVTNSPVFEGIVTNSFKDKIKLLIEICGRVFSYKSIDFFDPYKILTWEPTFWKKFDLMITSIKDEVFREKAGETPLNDVQKIFTHRRFYQFEEISSKTPRR